MKPRTLDTWMMKNGKTGDHYYSRQSDKNLTAVATHYNRKILTNKVTMISGSIGNPIVEVGTKVILL